jgi:hypothetical protein
MAAIGASAKRGALLWLAVAVVGVCAACGASGSGAVTESAPAPTPTPTPTSVAALHLPFDAYALSDTQEAVDEYLGLFLEKSCMTKLGFSFLPGLDAGYVARNAHIRGVRLAAVGYQRPGPGGTVRLPSPAMGAGGAELPFAITRFLAPPRNRLPCSASS